jgi:uncharacterized protein YqgC (DUF456 family)
MTIDIILIIAGFICLLTGLIGAIIPGLPGPPLSYAGLLLLHLTEQVQFTAYQLTWWFILMLLTLLADYLLPLWGVKKWNGSKWGNWGCVIGAFIGVWWFPPWGILFGPFIGAVIGELIFGKRTMDEALRSGFGSFVGFLLGTVFKISVCGWFAFCFIRALW